MTDPLRQRVRQEVRGYVLREFLPDDAPERLADDTPLIRGGILDSIAVSRLASHIEETFHIRIASHEIGVRRMDSVEEIVELVVEKIGT